MGKYVYQNICIPAKNMPVLAGRLVKYGLSHQRGINDESAIVAACGNVLRFENRITLYATQQSSAQTRDPVQRRDAQKLLIYDILSFCQAMKFGAKLST